MLPSYQLRLCRLRLPSAVLPGLRHQEQAEHEAHRRNGDRVDQSIAETARRLVRRRGDEWHQSAAPAIADVIWDGHRCVANLGWEIFSQKRVLLAAVSGFLEEAPGEMFTGWRSKRWARRQVAILEHHSSFKRRASQNEEAPTDERSGLGLPNHLVPLCAWDSGVNGSVLGKA